LIGLLGIRRQKTIDNNSPARWNRCDRDSIPLKLPLGKYIILQIFDWTGWTSRDMQTAEINFQVWFCLQQYIQPATVIQFDSLIPLGLVWGSDVPER
jgi:hypothetical protein